MAKLSNDDVLKLASLAKLKLTEDEVKKFQTEISDILDFVEQLHKVDAGGLEETSQVTGLENATRGDEEIEYGVSQAELLKNVPEIDGTSIKVKRVL